MRRRLAAVGDQELLGGGRLQEPGVSGRVRMKVATPASTSAWPARIQDATPASQVRTSIAAIRNSAVTFTRRSMLRCCCQFRMSRPKCRWSSSQRCSRGELRAKANAASSRNGVVGTSGSTVPAMPNPVDVSPSRSQRERVITICPTSHEPRRGDIFGHMGSSMNFVPHGGAKSRGRAVRVNQSCQPEASSHAPFRLRSRPSAATVIGLFCSG